MRLVRSLKIALGSVLLFPLVVAWSFFWLSLRPSAPLPIGEVFFGACATEYNGEIKNIERSHSYSVFPQGFWYEEAGEAVVSSELLHNILSNLKANSEFSARDGGFEKFIVGEVLAYCSINTDSGELNYRYVLW